MGEILSGIVGAVIGSGIIFSIIKIMYQKKMDEQLKKLDATNARLNHVMISLYDEEKKALKEVSGALALVVQEVFTNAKEGALNDYDKNLPQFQKCEDAIVELKQSLNSNRIFIDVDLFGKISELNRKALSNYYNFKFAAENTRKFSGKDLSDGILDAAYKKRMEIFDSCDELHPLLDEVISEMKKCLERKKKEHFGG